MATRMNNGRVLYLYMQHTIIRKASHVNVCSDLQGLRSHPSGDVLHDGCPHIVRED